MKPGFRPTRRIALQTLIVFLVLSGWVSWAVARQSLTELARQNREWEELNGYLLTDIRMFKSQVERIRRVQGQGRGPADVAMRKRLAELKNENGSLRLKIRDLIAKSEIPKDAGTAAAKNEAVRLGTLSLSGRGIEFDDRPSGKVVSVDESDEFVVVNLGKKSGVEVGTELLAVRGGSPVAKLHAIEVRDALAACEIEYLVPDGKLRPEDPVRVADRG